MSIKTLSRKPSKGAVVLYVLVNEFEAKRFLPAIA